MSPRRCCRRAVRCRRRARIRRWRRATTAAPTAASASNDFKRSLETANQLEEQRYNRDSREQLRQIISTHFGLLGYIRLLQNHLDYLQTSNTESAFDSELALVNWTQI